MAALELRMERTFRVSIASQLAARAQKRKKRPGGEPGRFSFDGSGLLQNRQHARHQRVTDDVFLVEADNADIVHLIKLVGDRCQA